MRQLTAAIVGSARAHSATAQRRGRASPAGLYAEKTCMVASAAGGEEGGASTAAQWDGCSRSNFEYAPLKTPQFERALLKKRKTPPAVGRVDGRYRCSALDPAWGNVCWQQPRQQESPQKAVCVSGCATVQHLPRRRRSHRPVKQEALRAAVQAPADAPRLACNGDCDENDGQVDRAASLGRHHALSTPPGGVTARLGSSCTRARDQGTPHRD